MPEYGLSNLQNWSRTEKYSSAIWSDRALLYEGNSIFSISIKEKLRGRFCDGHVRLHESARPIAHTYNRDARQAHVFNLAGAQIGSVRETYDLAISLIKTAIPSIALCRERGRKKFRYNFDTNSDEEEWSGPYTTHMYASQSAEREKMTNAFDRRFTVHKCSSIRVNKMNQFRKLKKKREEKDDTEFNEVMTTYFGIHTDEKKMSLSWIIMTVSAVTSISLRTR